VKKVDGDTVLSGLPFNQTNLQNIETINQIISVVLMNPAI
jgi:hypothetical protein